MKLDSVPTPSRDLPRAAQQAHQSLVTTVSYLENQRALRPSEVPTQATALRAYLLSVVAYLDANTGTSA